MEENPMGMERGGLQLIGYTVREILPDGERKPYFRGVGYWDEIINLEFIPNKSYIIQMSVVSIDPDHDLSDFTSIFGRVFPNGFQNVLEYYPFELESSFSIHPFATEITATLNEVSTRSNFYNSDKFVGEAIFEVSSEEFEISIDMFRLSGRLVLEATNLEKGELYMELVQGTSRLMAFSMGLNFPDKILSQERPAIWVRSVDDELVDKIKEELEEDDNGGWRRSPRPTGRRAGRLGSSFEGMLIHRYVDAQGIQRQRNIGLLNPFLERNSTVTYIINMENYPIENARQTGGMEFLEVEAEYSAY
ncbi:hypothetical protein KIH41_10020 [Litoribacter ruber]|uniref:hypothetical protein n=1 Tax=Litoribacter ruber TaxID=702568 RepID=UPI001BDB5FD7|nr:hypothetical protein [Litoribacter ruber]MBT0811613.1 hypothetical protein [Litoribacter ruber]